MTHECTNCGEQVTPERRNYRYSESGMSNVILQGVEVADCPKCGNSDVCIPKIAKLHRAIAQALANSPARLTGEQLRFLRKHLGLTTLRYQTLADCLRSGHRTPVERPHRDRHLRSDQRQREWSDARDGRQWRFQACAGRAANPKRQAWTDGGAGARTAALRRNRGDAHRARRRDAGGRLSAAGCAHGTGWALRDGGSRWHRRGGRARGLAWFGGDCTRRPTCKRRPFLMTVAPRARNVSCGD